MPYIAQSSHPQKIKVFWGMAVNWRERIMSDYRIYILDPQGHIRLGYDFQGRDDLSALEESKKHSNGDGIEIWQGSRQIARIDQAGESATP